MQSNAELYVGGLRRRRRTTALGTLFALLSMSGFVAKATRAAHPAHDKVTPLPVTPLPTIPARARALVRTAGGLQLSWPAHVAGADAASEPWLIRHRSGAQVQMQLLGFGRRHATPVVGAEARAVGCQSSHAAVAHDCRWRVEQTAPSYVQWWEGSAGSIEHGVTLLARPAGQGALVVALSVRGASVELDDSGQHARLLLPSGHTLGYRKLRVLDADGRAIDARMLATPQGLQIRLDDRAARYPLTIDPLLQAPQSPVGRLSSQQAGSQMGSALASAGDVNGDGYEDLLVGADGFDAGAQQDAGAVYAYYGGPTGLNDVPSWSFIGDQALAGLGRQVAGAGDVNGDGFDDVMVAAPDYDNGQPDEGRVYVFMGSASGLNATPQLVLESDQASAAFGSGLSAAGDINNDGYDDALIGAPTLTTTQPGAGRVFVYLGSAAGLSGTAAWSADGTQLNERFGHAVAGAGDINDDGFDDIVIGAPGHMQASPEQGRAWVYHGSSTGLPTTASWSFSPPETSGRFGFSVTGAGDVNGDGFDDIAVGAPLVSNGSTNEGRVYVFHGAMGGASLSPNFQAESNRNNALFGAALTGGGDTDGNGFDDIFVGFGSSGVSSMWVFGGDSTGLDPISKTAIGPKLTPATLALHGPVNSGSTPYKLYPFSGVQLTDAVALLDTDGDGFDDAITGELDGVCINRCWDMDGDGLEDFDELFFYASNPDLDENNWDTDGDGCSDLFEVLENGIYMNLIIAGDPLQQPADTSGCDFDYDGVLNGDELSAGTDPNDADSDDDGLLDALELAAQLDTDNDGLINALDPDSDNDGLFDGLEMGHDCSHPDTSLMAMSCTADGDMGATTTDPLNTDTDGGGITDGSEDVNQNGVVDMGETDPNATGDDPPCAVGDCPSGICADGVCCDQVCDQPCMACSAALKGGGVDGVCEPVTVGTDASGDCLPEAAETCGLSGVCDGAGQCQLHPMGTACAPALCGQGMLFDGVCDGAGVCTTGQLIDSCDDNDPCTSNGCDAGACSFGSVLDGTACEGGVCIAGSCVPDAQPTTGSGGSGGAGTGGAGGSATNGSNTSATGSGVGGATQAPELSGDGLLCSTAAPASPAREGASWWWLLLGALGLRRRRR